jgi:arabinogalactan endo-1,4-beta-galactosidase
MFFNKNNTSLKSERFMWFLLTLSILTFLTGCSVETGTNKTQEYTTAPIISAGEARTSEDYILGADVSSLAEYVDKGAIFIDTDGQEKPLLLLLKNHGFNYIRLRTFVEPGAEYGYASGEGQWCEAKTESYNDKAHIIEIAKQVKAAGMKLLLDFHYSDTWADPNKQVIPNAWRNINTIGDLANTVKNYTVDVLTQMKVAGVEPDMVQVGNEITPGMLIHIPTEDTDCYGNKSIVNDHLNGSVADWHSLATLLKAGISGVKQVNATTPIMLHIENTGDRDGVIHWVNQAIANDVKFDVLGLSAYEKWQGPSTAWQGTLDLLAQTYQQLSFSFVEYNPQPRLLNDIMHGIPNKRGLGTFFWEPVLSGEWGPSIFTQKGQVYTANPEDFAKFDRLVKDYSL